MVTPGAPHEDALLPIQEFLSCYLNATPALFWRIDIVRNEIIFLNTHTIRGLDSKASLLLRNTQFAREVILDKDWERFEECFELARRRRPFTGVFRVKNADGTIIWLKIAGMPDPVLSSCSIGFLMDFTSQMNALHTLAGLPGLSDKIDLFDTPVLLVRFHDRSVAMANQAACRLLGYDESDIRRLNIGRLLRETPPCTLHAVYENLIFADSWNGELTVTDRSGNRHCCDARVRAISREGENLLWLSLNHIHQPAATSERPLRISADIPEDVLKAMSASRTLKQLLEAMLTGLPEGQATDAIMLSRIFIDQNKVQVTGVGTPFVSVAENDTHLYAGSIAENIVQFGLDSLMVEDTSKSIKPIDWALFIPRGIRSYYARPFFENGVLRNVLIFCSTHPEGYSEDATATLDALLPSFAENLRRVLSR